LGQSCRTLRRLRRLLADTHTESVLSLSAGLITQELHAALELDALTLLQRRRPRMNRGPSTRPGGSFPPLGGGCASIRRKAVLHLMESSPHRRGAFATTSATTADGPARTDTDPFGRFFRPLTDLVKQPKPGTRSTTACERRCDTAPGSFGFLHLKGRMRDAYDPTSGAG
jgi:hypothetical protein